MSDEVTIVTPGDYWTKPRHRAIVDDLVKRAGVNLRDVALAEKFSHGWRLKVYKRRRLSGKFYVSVKGGIAHRWVNVP